jgi:hypothetical protein
VNPEPARVLTHGVHLVTFLVLLASGVLLLDPGLRAAVTGGYALTLSAVHRWGGIVFAAVPAAVAAAAGVRRVLAPAEWGRARGYLQGLHTVVTVALVAGFTITGALIWRRDLVSMAASDRAQELHDALTYAAAALLGFHLLDVAVAALVARWRTARAAPPLTERERRGG